MPATTAWWVGLLCLLRGEEPKQRGRGHPISWPWWVIAGVSLLGASWGFSNHRLVLYLKSEGWPKAFRKLLPRRFRRRIPDEATLSRRFRSDTLSALMRRVLGALAIRSPFTAIDGMVLAVGQHSRDPEARFGGAGSHYLKGYKAIRFVNDLGQPIDVGTESANRSELATAYTLLERASTMKFSVLRIAADGAYDSEDFHRFVEQTFGATLIAPVHRRGRKPQRGRRARPISGSYRRRTRKLLRSAWGKRWFRMRQIVERSNAWIRMPPFNLTMLPTFIRRRHRVLRWQLSLEVLLSYAILLRTLARAA